MAKKQFKAESKRCLLYTSLASHDHEMVQTVANRIIEFTENGQYIDRSMTYDEYLAYKKSINA